MGIKRKNANVEVGKRLRDARQNLGYRQAEFACALDVTEEHYRKYESGATGLSAEKLLILHRDYKIDPTYLITGSTGQNVDFDAYMANCSREERGKFFERVLVYMSRLLKGMD